MVMERFIEYLEKLGIPGHEVGELTTSKDRFPDGAQYRVEVPGIQNPEGVEGLLEATDKYNVWTPTGRAINPITNTNWEGVGVKPDIKTYARDAILTAHIKALDSLKNGNEDIDSKKYYEWHLKALKTKKKPLNIDLSTLKTYTGNFGVRTISLMNGKLYYQRKNSMKYALIPMSNDVFMIEGLSDYRIQFLFKNNNFLRMTSIILQKSL